MKLSYSLLILTLIIGACWFAFGSVSLNELAEKRCKVPTKSELQQVTCLADFTAGIAAGIRYAHNTPDDGRETIVTCSQQGECVIHLPAAEAEPK